MTPAEWDALGRYVEKLRDSLNLAHWHIDLLREPPDAVEQEPDANLIDGQIEISKGGDQAKLRLHRDFRDGEPELQRSTILHELLHLHVDRLFSAMIESIESLASAQTGVALRNVYQPEYERMTERLADAIAPKYDLIEWPSEGQHAQGEHMDSENTAPPADEPQDAPDEPQEPIPSAPAEPDADDDAADDSDDADAS
jgi:Uri superfamily endonuclease